MTLSVEVRLVVLKRSYDSILIMDNNYIGILNLGKFTPSKLPLVNLFLDPGPGLINPGKNYL